MKWTLRCFAILTFLLASGTLYQSEVDLGWTQAALRESGYSSQAMQEISAESARHDSNGHMEVSAGIILAGLAVLMLGVASIIQRLDRSSTDPHDNHR